MMAAFLVHGEALFHRRAGDVEYGEREFLIQDPDGSLLRFSSGLGERPATASGG